MNHRCSHRLIFALWVLLLGLTIVHQESHAATLTAAQAKDHVGENTTVCGVVVDTKFAARSNRQPTFLNLDKPYPKPIFTILIWGNDRPKFGQPENTYNQGKHLCVTGIIEVYYKTGVPQIVVTDPGQIKEAAVIQQEAMQSPRATPIGRPRKPRALAKAGDCEGDHWIEFVSDDGDIIKLEDGSVWRVDPGDTVDAALWLPPTDVIVCEDKIINLDDNEKVGVTRLR